MDKVQKDFDYFVFLERKMVFAIDAGNTNIVLGVYDNDKLMFTSRLATQASLSEDEYAIAINNILQLYSICPKEFEGAIISSVVPPLNSTLKNALKKLLNCKIFVVSPGIKTGLNIKLDNPAILGADLVCGAVGALAKYSAPCIVFDLGTATTISAIDENKCFLGGSIIPGVRISLNALSSSTAQLPHISLDDYDGTVIGKNTLSSMQSGIILGNAGMIDAFIEKYREILGQNAIAIATGGLAGSIVKYCKNEVICDNDLLLDGLYSIYKINAKS